MISLITGLPGSGKTSLMVHMLMTRPDLQNRPLYVDGIPELKIPHMPIPDGEDMTTWHNWAPTGAVLVIDEAQRIFRPRPAGAKVPDFVQELETHRHKGIDIFILTQSPRLIDVNVRALVGEHRNISRTMLGLKRVSYWQKCANPESRNDVAEAKNSIFTMKKDAFGMYKSAEEHTKLKGALSSWVWFMPVLLFAVVYVGMELKQSYEAKIQPESAQHQQTEQTSKSADEPQGTVGGSPKHENNRDTGMGEASEQIKPLAASDFEPSIEGKPWTAAFYNGLNRNVQTMPYPAGCVKSADKCTCYTDQATPIREIKKDVCIDYAENGIYNPYINSEYSQNTVMPREVEQSQTQVLQLGQ